jgi:hypothetical protein
MKLSKDQIFSILIVAMSFGTAWAVRGQFGHEQGAAWAAAIGGLSLVLVSRRNDWYQRVLSVTLASAVGWGMGGMISYGQVVGYGRSDDFFNATYGLLMLFVIGGLYGLIGGGLTGLTLESNSDKRVKWAQLMAEMVAGGLVAYGFLIMQLEILMTPPRSEAWAFCFGAGLALVWYMARNGFKSSLKVAFITMIGGGFGFAFGNFLQILGNILQIDFNMWNVMEYSIGFFGGLSLAYGIFTSPWPKNTDNPKLWENRVLLLIAMVFIPLVVFQQSLTIPVLIERLGNSGIDEKTAMLSSIFSGLLICLIIVYYVVKFEKSKFVISQNTILMVFLTFLSVYVAVSFIVSGVLAGKLPFNHVLYVVNIAVIMFLLRFVKNPFAVKLNQYLKINHLRFLATILVIIVLLALLLVNIHGELNGFHNRFE